MILVLVLVWGWFDLLESVIPAKAGIHLLSNLLDEVDPGFRRGDEGQYLARIV